MAPWTTGPFGPLIRSLFTDLEAPALIPSSSWDFSLEENYSTESVDWMFQYIFLILCTGLSSKKAPANRSSGEVSNLGRVHVCEPWELNSLSIGL